MKLIKINTDHYIIVDDSEIKVGDYYLRYNQSIMKCTLIKLQFNEALNKEETIISSDGYGDPYERSKHFLKKITHSTQPIESVPLYKMPNGELIDEIWYDKIQQLSLSEVKKLIGEVDVEKKAEKWFESQEHNIYNHYNTMPSYVSGYNQALEDNKEKKYTEEDIDKAYWAGMQFVGEDKGSFGEFIQSLQPKTEWEVEIVDGKLKLM